jgi:hypothetical protein
MYSDTDDDEKLYDYKKCLGDHILYKDEETDEEWEDMIYDHNNNLLPPGWQKRVSNKKSETKTNTTKWCSECNDVYHDICELGSKQLNELYPIFNEKLNITDYDTMIKQCKTYDNEKDTYHINKARMKKVEINDYLDAISNCKHYRKNHHKYCFRNINDKEQTKGDPGHQYVINKLNDVITVCKKARNNLDKNIKKLSLENKNKAVMKLYKSPKSKRIKSYTTSRSNKMKRKYRSKRK